MMWTWCEKGKEERDQLRSLERDEGELRDATCLLDKEEVDCKECRKRVSIVLRCSRERKATN